MKYIGHQYTYKDPYNGKEIELIPQQDYPINIEYDGPQVVINGQPVIDPNGTLWVSFQDGLRIPYAPNLLNNFWE